MSEELREDQIGIQEAAKIAGVSIKTIRRHRESGKLTATIVRGRRGDEYMFSRQEVESLGKPAPKVLRSPLDDVRKELESMRKALDERAEAEAERERQRQEQSQEQTRTIDALRAEVRDSRHQLNQLHEQLRLALPAPKKAHWWQFWKGE